MRETFDGQNHEFAFSVSRHIFSIEATCFDGVSCSSEVLRELLETTSQVFGDEAFGVVYPVSPHLLFARPCQAQQVRLGPGEDISAS